MINILKKIKSHYYLLVLLFIILFYNTFISLLANINGIGKNKYDYIVAENNILKEKNNYLLQEIENISSLELYAKYNYSLTRISYRELYNNSDISIIGGIDKGYKVGNALINDKGLVGIITEVYDKYSRFRLITNITDFSVRINDSYGSIKEYKDDLLLVENISNYDEIHLNDDVYTSSLGNIHESLYIGYVTKINEHNINKEVYIKSKVDFNKLNYLYVVGCN